MRYAFISDIHGKTQVLKTFLAGLADEAVDMLVCLGDTGTDSAYDLLRTIPATGSFGNYEVSGYLHLSSENQRYILELPPVFAHDDFLAAHAVPYHPAALANAADFHEHMARTGMTWRALFPYPGQDEDTLWKIYAELLAKDKHIFFHGHTHRQQIWAIDRRERLKSLKVDHLALENDVYLIIGVGSLGHPEDGPHPRYVIYDSRTRRIEPRTLKMAKSRGD